MAQRDDHGVHEAFPDEGETLSGLHTQTHDADSTANLPSLAVVPSGVGTKSLVDLKLETTIGSGSSATVWMATQHALRRTVAVKQLRSDRNHPRSRAHLLQEARITGALEHPNIVPVHGLGVDEDDSPLLIMKYIEGTPWRATMEPLYTSDGPPDPERLDRQLRILLAVISAIHFAHSRGVLHRDIKPANVMLGPHEEVYVVDWGLAVALRPDVDLPRAAAVDTITGSPAYLAPEMAAAQGRALGPWTDVYQIGAILHELMIGEVRNVGATASEQLATAYRGVAYAYPPWVPIELGDICNRACHVDPRARYQDAGAFRRALEAFLQHRSSRALAIEAHTRVDKLRALAETSSDGAPSVAPSAWARWAAEARFGYQQALREWPENADARQGLDQLLDLLVHHELARDNPQAAAELASELTDPAPDLRTRISLAQERVDARQRDAEALAQHRHQQDPAVAMRTRHQATIANGVAILLSASFLFTLRITGIRQPGFLDLIVVTGVIALTMTYNEHLIRKEGHNELNRKLHGGLIRITGLIGGLFALAWWAGMDIIHAEALAMFLAGSGGIIMAVTIEPELRWGSLGFLVTSVGVLAFPAARGLVIGTGALVSFLLLTFAWRRISLAPGC